MSDLEVMFPTLSQRRGYLFRAFGTFVLAPTALVLAVTPGAKAEHREAASVPEARASTKVSDVLRQSRPEVDLDTLTREGPHYMARLRSGGTARLTLDTGLQKEAESIFDSYNIPFGAAVVVSVADGRVLALAGRSRVDASLGPAELALRPWAPAASVFKVISAAALVSEAGLGAGTRICYHGGVSSLLPPNLLDLPALDTRCDTLGFGIAKSQNAIVAKLAIQHLSADSLGRVATAFGFGQPLPFDAEVGPSEIEIPETPMEFARAAAGFWHSSLSVLHGALIAATIARGGTMPSPRLIDRAVDAQGKPLTMGPMTARRVLDPAAAAEVGRMMTLTTRMGTARRAFHDRRGRALLPIDVAGKTGSLSFRGNPGDPALPAAIPDGSYLGYSWFVGFAPATNPQVAFAVLIGNSATWRIKAPFVAQRLIAEHLAAHAQTPHLRSVASR